jgi:hypothetical protein
VDIRLVRPKGGKIWVWTGSLAALALGALVLSMIFGDPTASMRIKKRMAVFPTQRSAVTPLRAVSFETVRPLEDRALGRLLHLSGTLQSGIVRNSAWVKADGGRRILVRFDPAPPAGALSSMLYSGRVEVDGYLSRIAEAEFKGWMDSLHVAIPRPEPGVKFGDVPDSNFVRIDSLFIKSYYLAVRPNGIAGSSGAATPARTPVEGPASTSRAERRITEAAPAMPSVAPADSATLPAMPPPDSTGPPP